MHNSKYYYIYINCNISRKNKIIHRGLKIYTKTGDTGKTSLLYGKRVSKGDLKIESYGAVDELNAFVGLLRDAENEDIRRHFLLEIQNCLFVIGSNLANEKAESKLPKLDDADIDTIETEIDKITAQLPKLKHFILPGGHEKVSICHICRTVCRRAERMVVNLTVQEEVDNNIIIYLNRLSDYFFVLSRIISKELGVEEVKWVPKK